MLKWFICPDGERIGIKDCLDGCRLHKRCATVPFLRVVSWGDRKWNGKVSVTMLDGTGERVYWLKDREDYAMEPQARVFAILGTGAHKALEDRGDEYGADAERRLEWEGITGIADLIEEEDGEKVLTDYKVSGSFAVMKAVGITKVGERPVTDQYGNPVLFSRGVRKGQQKTDPVYAARPGEGTGDGIARYAMQPNFYRVMYEETTGEKVAQMRIMFIVRDGGLWDARKRGVTRNTYMCAVPRMDNDEVKEIMRRRRDEIVEAMVQDVVPPVCTTEQAWGGNRCRRFCDVRDLCAKLEDNPWLKGHDEED